LIGGDSGGVVAGGAIGGIGLYLQATARATKRDLAL